MKADKNLWAVRANTYNNIDWVNRNDTIKKMIDLSVDINLNIEKILDIGTGTGKVLSTFKEVYPDATCYGIDISSEMFSKIENSDGIIFKEMNCETMEFEDNTFDIATARMSFHHVDNLEKAIKEVNRVLKPEGKFILCEGTPPSVDTLEFYKEVFALKEDRTTFLVDDLDNLFNTGNFKDITIKTVRMSDMSLNNWVENAGTPQEHIDEIKRLHWEAPDYVKKAYNMKEVDNDILMDWKFVVISGVKI